MSTTINGIPVSEILNPTADDESLVERISHRKTPASLEISEPDPKWPAYFETFKSRITSAWETHSGNPSQPQTQILSISHVGSTSVPNLPAKAIIDIDLVLSDNTLPYEIHYIPLLEQAGFQYLLREPRWYEHRFLVATEPVHCNLHVWGPKCAQVERHNIFRDYLRENDADRELYAETKRECSRAARENGENMQEYSRRKDAVVREILVRACRAAGAEVEE